MLLFKRSSSRSILASFLLAFTIATTAPAQQAQGPNPPATVAPPASVGKTTQQVEAQTPRPAVAATPESQAPTVRVVAAPQEAGTPTPRPAVTARPAQVPVATCRPAISATPAQIQAPTLRPAVIATPPQAGTPTPRPAVAAHPERVPVATCRPAISATPAQIQAPTPRPAVLAAPLHAETPTRHPAVAATPQPVQAPAAAPKASTDFVEEKGFKAKVFEIKHRDPARIQEAVQLLGSGFKGAYVSASRDMHTVTIRDFPENIAAVEDAIKRLDVPETAAPAGPPRPDLEIHVHILVASSSPGTSDEVPAELTDVIKQLQGTLKYKGYGVMTSAIHRTGQGNQGVVNSGVAESKLFNISTPGGNPIFYNYKMSPITTRVPGGTTIEMGFQLSMRIPLNLGGQAQQVQYENVGFSAPVNVQEGEKVVVGTTTMGDKGLIVVLSAKILK